MKSLTTLVFAASAALTAAQVTMNGDGTFTCAIPNAAYCAGDSLTTNIIIRCTGTVGQPGNCDDNLDGDFPPGLNYSPCWQPSATSGMAACSKNCVVYGGSGNYNGTFTLPASVCTPLTTQSSSMSSTSSVSGSSSASSSVTASVSTTTTSPAVSYTTITSAYTTVTVPCPSGTPTTTPSGTSVPTTPASSPSGGASTAAGNGTVTTSTPSSPGGSATATPVGPTTTAPASFTGGAVANQAAGVFAAGGLLIAYFL